MSLEYLESEEPQQGTAMARLGGIGNEVRSPTRAM